MNELGIICDIKDNKAKVALENGNGFFKCFSKSS